MLNVATSNTLISIGINNTACKLKKPIKNASQVYLFENSPMAKIDSLARELKPCTNRDKHNVVNAIVLAVKVSPVDNPISKAIVVEMAISNPSSTT